MLSPYVFCLFQNHWFIFNELMRIESVTQSISNLALQFGDDDAEPGAMVIASLRTIEDF